MTGNCKGKICLVANTDWYLYNFRLSLAKILRAAGWDVLLISPAGPYVPALEKEDFRWIEWPVNRKSLGLHTEIKALLLLLQIYKTERPVLVHHFTVKPVLYGSLSARILGVPAIVNSITGLGYVFLRADRGWAILRTFVMALYRLAFGASNVRVIFENKDDQRTFLQYHLVEPQYTQIVEGIGVDVDRFNPQPEYPGTPIVILPARMLWDKGVGVLVEAARILKSHRDVRIVLVGTPDPGNPANINESILNKWHEEGLIEYWGFRIDMEEVYKQAHIVCLPSKGEGLPTVLIEAAASGRPIVATDVPGCREVVTHGENGLLVPPNDPTSLAEALETLLQDPTLRQRMGAAGRLQAIEKFSAKKIIAATLDVYDQLFENVPK